MVATTWISLRRPLGNDGRSGRSISLAVRMAVSDGRPSRRKKPPGILPAAYMRSSTSTVSGMKSSCSLGLLPAVAVTSSWVSPSPTTTAPPASLASLPVSSSMSLPPPAADHLQQAAARVVVVLVDPQVLGELVDAGGEQGHLDLGRAGVALLGRVLRDDLGLVVLDQHAATSFPCDADAARGPWRAARVRSRVPDGRRAFRAQPPAARVARPAADPPERPAQGRWRSRRRVWRMSWWIWATRSSAVGKAASSRSRCSKETDTWAPSRSPSKSSTWTSTRSPEAWNCGFTPTLTAAGSWAPASS